MNTYLIKVNSQDQKEKGFPWILLEYNNFNCEGEPNYINAKGVSFTSSSFTFERNNQYFIKITGKLILQNNWVTII